MREIKYFLAKNLLYLIDSRASCIRVENVHMGNSVRRINMGRDALLGHKQAVRVARWLDVATPHPSNTVGIGLLPVVVTPTICNLGIERVLINGGAGLNLLSPVVFR